MATQRQAGVTVSRLASRSGMGWDAGCSIGEQGSRTRSTASLQSPLRRLPRAKDLCLALLPLLLLPLTSQCTGRRSMGPRPSQRQPSSTASRRMVADSSAPKA